MTLTRSFNSLKFFRRELPNCQVKLELLGTANFSKPSLLMTCPFADYLILKHHLPRLENILQSNMIVIQDIFSLLCVIVPLMTIYFLMTRPAMQREPVENDERPVLASRTIANGQRTWASENISHSIQPSRNFPTEHDERYD